MKNAAQTAASTEGAQATSIGSYITPQLESWAGGNAPGYGQGAVNQMTSAAQTAAGAASNQAKQSGLLRALRTGNAAGVAAGDVSAAVNSGQNQTQAVEDVLGLNAQLKAQQQTGALNMLGSLYGEDVTGQISNLNTALGADMTGWYQNMLSGIQTGSEAAKNIMQGIGSLKGGEEGSHGDEFGGIAWVGGSEAAAADRRCGACGEAARERRSAAGQGRCAGAFGAAQGGHGDG